MDKSTGELPDSLIEKICDYGQLIAGRTAPEDARSRLMLAIIEYGDARAALAQPPEAPAARLAPDGGEVSREHSSDDMTVPKPTADLQIGDYVFACRWGDGEPGDPWAVGWINEINLTCATPFVGLKDSHRGWRHAMKITEEQGHRICTLYPAAEGRSNQERLAARAEAFGLAATPSPTASASERGLATEQEMKP